MTKIEQSTSDQLLHTHHIFRAHQELLEDAVRNRGFYHALRKHISADSTVLDIGAGTGLWAIAAAKLGAKRVVAIERDELLAALIRNLVRENQVGARVEIAQGDSREITVGRDFDVIISETIGNLGFDEQKRNIKKMGTKEYSCPFMMLFAKSLNDDSCQRAHG